MFMSICSSIYQDVPLYSLEEFKRLAPEEARTEAVLQDEHQLMLNRLSFELVERQRYALLTRPTLLWLSFASSLDQRKRELLQEKEELLKESKSKVTTMDNIKVQVDTLMKASPYFTRQTVST
jgi:THO complex subunit 5